MIKPIKSIRPTIVFTDVDDTLTYNGMMPSEALDALYKLQKQNIIVIPVTGACAGWCDQFARIWPVTAVIGENGAFVIEKSGNKIIYNDSQTSKERTSNYKIIQNIANIILTEYPSLKPAQDNIYRRYDYAIDYNQQVSGITDEIVDAVLTICKENNINATASSIHINMWVGEFDKLSASKQWLAKNTNLNSSEQQNECFYIGDSLNDELMFSYYTNSVGVANIKPYLSKLKFKPKRIMTKNGGLGFAEWVDYFLDDLASKQSN